jgi:hypothetical protein
VNTACLRSSQHGRATRREPGGRNVTSVSVGKISLDNSPRLQQSDNISVLWFVASKVPAKAVDPRKVRMLIAKEKGMCERIKGIVREAID